MDVKASSLRWGILRQALLRRRNPAAGRSPDDEQSTSSDTKRISRKKGHGFNLIPAHIVDVEEDLSSRDACVCYTLPVDGSPKLFITQRADSDIADLKDFENSIKYNVDNTGLVCHWPSEEVLGYFCLSHADMFRSKKVIELGSGYGLAGLAIAATTQPLEVVISDGNPQVVDYIQHNIDANSGVFGSTKVKTMTLHWDKEISSMSNSFDVIVASDCTFFKEFHRSLANTVKLLLRKASPSEAIFFSPKRGDSLDNFLRIVEEYGLRFSVTENYDTKVWRLHQGFINGSDSGPAYEPDHCYPLLIRVTL